MPTLGHTLLEEDPPSTYPTFVISFSLSLFTCWHDSLLLWNQPTPSSLGTSCTPWWVISSLTPLVVTNSRQWSWIAQGWHTRTTRATKPCYFILLPMEQSSPTTRLTISSFSPLALLGTIGKSPSSSPFSLWWWQCRNWVVIPLHGVAQQGTPTSSHTCDWHPLS